jgi:hypothetical protein
MGEAPRDQASVRASADPAPDGARAVPARRGRRLRGAGRAGLFVVVLLAVLAGGLGLALLALTGRPLPLPVWAVAQIEARANAALVQDLPGAALSLGRVEIRVDEDLTPRLRIEDLRLMQAGGRTLLALPDVRANFDAGALVSGQGLKPESLRILGAAFQLRRREDGSFDFALGAGQRPDIGSLPEALALLDRALAAPILSHLRHVELEASTLTLEDARLGRVWSVGDGRMRLDFGPDGQAAELALSLLSGGQAPARAVVTLVRPAGEALLRLGAAVEGVAAGDLAAQTPLLAWLGVVAAPISGRIDAEVTEAGLAALSAEMELGAGAVQPEATAPPIPFDKAALRLAYEPDEGRIRLQDLSIESRTLRLGARGHSYLLSETGALLSGPLGGRLPAAFLGQVSVTGAQIDPEGLFERPLVFTGGAVDARLELNPFRLDLGQITLIEERGRRLSLSGLAEVAGGGWRVAMDLGLDAMEHDRLLQLWPKALVPNTRTWVGQNVAEGLLTDIKAALRLDPGQEPRLSLGYEFDGAEVRFLRTLPPITRGSGRSSVDGTRYMIVLDRGEVEAPVGGRINVAGSVFSIPDVTQRPAHAEIDLRTESSITAALSLLDLPPFQFMSKSDRPVDLAEGRALIETRLRLPLQPRVQLPDVEYRVAGQLLDVTSDRLIAGKRLEADVLRLEADGTGLTISGPGTVGAARFAVAFRQDFGPEARGRSRVTGEVTLSPAALAEFGVTLPEGMVTGQGLARIDLALERGAPGRLRLTSDLEGIGLALAPVGWAKPAATPGSLAVEAELTQPPLVTRLAVEAPDLALEGRLTLAPGGGLERAEFAELRLGRWLEGPVTLIGRGAGRMPEVSMTGGQIDLRRFDPPAGQGRGTGEGAPIRLSLDRLAVTDGMSIIGMQGEFSTAGGFNGAFRGSLNGEARIAGTAVPARHGTAVRVTAEDAGAALRAAGVFQNAGGGRLDLTLTPRAQRGSYDGRAEMRGIRLRKTNVLAELLSAVSVVGLLEQLNGSGILFNSAEFDFVLTPGGVEISQGSAVGASIGLSMVGVYVAASRQLALQGVISPIYLVNGIGAAVTRRGEGLFGFNYDIRGRSDAPEVQVNPLSILTPGRFRELFRRPPPVLGQQTQ